MTIDTFYNKICSMEEIGLKLDKEMRYPEVARHFSKKYGMSFHGASILLNTGCYPGVKKKRALEIGEEINALNMPYISKHYYGSAIKQKIKKYYGKDIFEINKPIGKCRCEHCGGLLP